MKPTALDLFCGGGGTTIGLMQAGFQVTGVDIIQPKNYPGHDFIKKDVRDIPIDFLLGFDYVTASPPCHRHSIATRSQRDFDREKYPCYIEQVREMLRDHPLYSIENVPLAPLRTSLILTGQPFGLKRLWRKRHFENSFIVPQPSLGNRPRNCISVTTSMCSNNHYYRRKKLGLQGRPPLWVCLSIMGYPRWTWKHYPKWTLLNYHEVGNSVPPPYARYIAEHAKAYL